MSPVEKEILERIKRLRPEEQNQVLELARQLAEKKRGLPGTSLLDFGGLIEVDDLADMTKAIEEGCETVNVDEW